jgi:hypothetical protein
MPTVSTFTPTTDLGNGRKGLQRSFRSVSQAAITGTGLGTGMPVTVKYAAATNPNMNSRKWVGLLEKDDTGPGFHAGLECMAADTSGAEGAADVQLGSGVGDPADVTVTVTVGDSEPVPKTITIGP